MEYRFRIFDCNGVLLGKITLCVGKIIKYQGERNQRLFDFIRPCRYSTVAQGEANDEIQLNCILKAQASLLICNSKVD